MEVAAADELHTARWGMAWADRMTPEPGEPGVLTYARNPPQSNRRRASSTG
ncbi:hypothetical protein ABZT06_46945 [Streptomyces sp. NPDC005483]|uniref:hypothetical protein n=1 Tax=Streptomyces sp. NPDC005483 TaxID=3154882 RepID=UPI0033BF5FC1